MVKIAELVQLSNLVQPELVTLAICLFVFGIVLKSRTPIDNALIPYVLWATAFVVGALGGWSHSVGPARWYDALVTGGLVNGTVATAFSTLIWDMWHGSRKRREKRREEG